MKRVLAAVLISAAVSEATVIGGYEVHGGSSWWIALFVPGCVAIGVLTGIVCGRWPR